MNVAARRAIPTVIQLNQDEFAALLCGLCNGHGDCIHDSTTNNVTCACVEGYTGQYCEYSIVVAAVCSEGIGKGGPVLAYKEQPGNDVILIGERVEGEAHLRFQKHSSKKKAKIWK
ncbi:unnamed protein product [Strongylus vulgaris]|uniref:EGF-like domain-containing protein n=1 Tax=Strongylus vulgaris TaxID=40348 RepID=A0A3P7M0W6_STRVU|nr:unnamed protein product [Strongylus vulgaris]